MRGIQRLVVLLGLLGGCMVTQAQTFYNLTAEQLKIDSLLPTFNKSWDLGEHYNDSVYRVAIEYPEFRNMNKTDIARYRKITKELTIAYKQDLMDHYRISSVNSMLAPVNRFLRFCGMQQMCIKTCRTQRQYFRKEEELTKEEYLLLVETAERTGRIRLKLLMQTLACTFRDGGACPGGKTGDLQQRKAAPGISAKEAAERTAFLLRR